MVAPVVGHHHVFQSVRLSDTNSYRQHDAIAERHHRRLHILVGIVAFGYLFPTLQQRTLEVFRHEVQWDGDMFDA